MKRLDWFLARRYLSARRGGRLLSFITWVALGGVIVGVTALVVVIGVMTGMQKDLTEKILTSNAHVLILQTGSSLRMSDWEDVRDTVLAIDGVTAAAPFVFGSVQVLREGYSRAAAIYGLQTESTGGAPTLVEERIQQGIYDLRPPESGLPPMLMGGGLAGDMQVFHGDTLLVASFENLRADLILGGFSPATKSFQVTGQFTTGMYDADTQNLYTTLEAAQDLLGLSEENQVSGIGVQTSDPDQASEIAQELGRRLGFQYSVRSWMVTNRSLFSALKLEKLAMFVILFLIVVVAAFNIVSTLVMVVADRTREIGILKSMGMSDDGILRVFMLQGAWIGIVGTFIGTACGLVVCWAIDTFDLIRIPPDIYFVDRLPVRVEALDILSIVSASLLVAFVATIYPAFQAAKLQPVEAIRSE